MSTLRFLQLSDVHFGAPLTGGKLGLPPEAARLRAQERREAFGAALELVQQRSLDGVLVPGDLFDDESIDLDTLRFVAAEFARIAPKPVFIVPGNHDPFGGASPYRIDEETGTGESLWSDNVHIFAHEEMRTVRWPGRADVSVTGCGFLANQRELGRRLSGRVNRTGAAFELLLFHGSRGDGGHLQSHKETNPFTRDELLAQDFDWVALGHYHSFSMLSDTNGRVRAAYSGCLTAGGLDETGEKGCLVVTLSEATTEAEFVCLDKRRSHKLECDLSGAGFKEEARRRIDATVTDSGARTDDLVHLRLTGRRAQGLELDFLDDYASSFFHLKFDTSGMVADVDLDRYPDLADARTTEERFVAHLRAQLGQDVDGTTHRALLYGLDALHRGSLGTRYEE